MKQPDHDVFDSEELQDLPPVWDDLKNILQDMKMSRESGDTVGTSDAIEKLHIWKDSNPEESLAITHVLLCEE